MYLLSAAALLLAVLAPRPTQPAPVRHPSHAEVVAARELAVEPVPSADAKASPAPPPVRVEASKPAAEMPDFRAIVAVQLESLPICRRAGGPEGPGLAEVTYRPDGTASISLSRNYAGSSVGACVARRFGNAARPFDGEPVTIKFRFAV